MWRALLAAAIAYACGHPKLDGYRPAALNVPLQAFYQQVNLAAHAGRQALTSFGRGHSRYVDDYVTRAERQLRGASALAAPFAGTTPSTPPTATPTAPQPAPGQ
jgi:hypothetical protein